MNDDTLDRELSITRLVDAAPDQLYAGWTRPDLLTQWFAPKPWSCVQAVVDAYPGGEFAVTMRDPEGHDFPNSGVILEIVENERIVWTDAFAKGWLPHPDPFMVATVTFETEGDGTRYTARVRHWTAEAKERHEAMGFEKGWNQCLDQLLALIAR